MATEDEKRKFWRQTRKLREQSDEINRTLQELEALDAKLRMQKQRMQQMNEAWMQEWGERLTEMRAADADDFSQVRELTSYQPTKYDQQPETLQIIAELEEMGVQVLETLNGMKYLGGRQFVMRLSDDPTSRKKQREQLAAKGFWLHTPRHGGTQWTGGVQPAYVTKQQEEG